MKCFDLENPTRDLENNISHNDYRFLCVYGYTETIPGVTIDKNMSELKDKYGIRCIDGTTDAIEDDEHLKLMNSVVNYAEEYNTELLRKLGIKQKP